MDISSRPSVDEINTFEDRVRQQLRDLAERYRLEADPLIAMLYKIQACRPPQPIMIDLNAMNELDRQAFLDRMKQLGVSDT